MGTSVHVLICILPHGLTHVSLSERVTYILHSALVCTIIQEAVICYFTNTFGITFSSHSALNSSANFFKFFSH